MKYYIWLQLCLGQGSKTFLELLEKGLSPKYIYSMNFSERKQLDVFSKGELERINKTPIQDAVKIIEQCNKNKIKLIKYGDDNYPETLKNINTWYYANAVPW